MSQCKIIAIANQKGGVGKTTTTFNLGVSLAKQNISKYDLLAKFSKLLLTKNIKFYIIYGEFFHLINVTQGGDINEK